jgi:hypothetical protein
MFIFSPCFKSGIPNNRMFLNFTSYQQIPEYVSKAMGNGWKTWAQFPPGSEVCALSPCADWLWYPNLPPVQCSPKLWQPKHDTDQSQFNVSSCPFRCSQAMVLGHLLFHVSIISRVHKAEIPIPHTYSATDLTVPLGFCFVKN